MTGFRIGGGKRSVQPVAPAKAAVGARRSFLKRGAEAQKAAKQDDAEREARKEQQGKLWRFYIRPDEKARVTFLNGAIAMDGPYKGMFDVPFVREHRVNVPGRKVPDFYVCIAEDEACPLCDNGNQASLVGLFAVIDHRTYEGQKGTYQHQRRIFAAKAQTVKRLAALAEGTELKSLVGCTVDVGRLDQRSATVGDTFALVAQNPLERLAKKWEDGAERVKEPDWDEEMVVLSAAEMAARWGLQGPSGPGYPPTHGSDEPEDGFNPTTPDDPPLDDLPF